jgi:hydroxypyruvate reductase
MSGTDKFHEMRHTARGIFLQALEKASIAGEFARQVHCEQGILRICDDLYDLQSYSRIFVASIGKAGHTMVEALARQLGKSRVEGMVVSSVDPAWQERGFRYFKGGHPTPNAESVQAAKAIVKALQAQTASSLVLFLLSGGGSSLVETPIHDEISLPDLIATYRVLVHSGAPIAEINAIRKHLSAVKGGRLAQAAFPAHQVSLLVSDVPDATPDALASGPTMPDSTTAEDCYRIAEKHGMLPQLPASTRELLERHGLEETPKAHDPAFSRSRFWTLLSNRSALDQACQAARLAGFTVQVDNSCDDWDYKDAAQHLLRKLREWRERGEPVCLISGGEVTVKVANGGVGGRNQQFALECAASIAGENITVLSAGTDGIDGNSPAAGGVVDGTTMARGQSRGLDVAKALQEFDAYPLLAAIGDAIEIGPTGNNLRDLRILLSY